MSIDQEFADVIRAAIEWNEREAAWKREWLHQLANDMERAWNRED
jgi:hypothetical protein